MELGSKIGSNFFSRGGIQNLDQGLEDNPDWVETQSLIASVSGGLSYLQHLFAPTSNAPSTSAKTNNSVGLQSRFTNNPLLNNPSAESPTLKTLPHTETQSVKANPSIKNFPLNSTPSVKTPSLNSSPSKDKPFTPPQYPLILNSKGELVPVGDTSVSYVDQTKARKTIANTYSKETSSYNSQPYDVNGTGPNDGIKNVKNPSQPGVNVGDVVQGTGDSFSHGGKVPISFRVTADHQYELGDGSGVKFIDQSTGKPFVFSKPLAISFGKTPNAITTAVDAAFGHQVTEELWPSMYGQNLYGPKDAPITFVVDPSSKSRVGWSYKDKVLNVPVPRPPNPFNPSVPIDVSTIAHEIYHIKNHPWMRDVVKGKPVHAGQLSLYPSVYEAGGRMESESDVAGFVTSWLGSKKYPDKVKFSWDIGRGGTPFNPNPSYMTQYDASRIADLAVMPHTSPHLLRLIGDKAFANFIQGIGMDRMGEAGELWNLANRQLDAFSGYGSQREATLAAAKAKYGENSSEVKVLTHAWDSVGVPSTPDSNYIAPWQSVPGKDDAMQYIKSTTQKLSQLWGSPWKAHDYVSTVAAGPQMMVLQLFSNMGVPLNSISVPNGLLQIKKGMQQAMPDAINTTYDPWMQDTIDLTAKYLSDAAKANGLPEYGGKVDEDLVEMYNIFLESLLKSQGNDS